MTWLSIVPSIPLAPSVPCVGPVPGIVAPWLRMTTIYPGGAVEAGGRVWWCARTSGMLRVAESDLRVDLSDPQGFSYALRWLFSTGHTSLPYARDVKDKAVGGLLVHDTDRLTLARALAEVQQ